jgi:hypothetical protein
MQKPNILTGTVHGKRIDLNEEPGLPDGQAVSVTLLAESHLNGGLRRSFGSWADDADGLDQFLADVRRDRAGRRDQFSQ